MKRITALPNEVGIVLDAAARKRTRGSDETELAKVRAELVIEWMSDFGAALAEIVDDLRARGLTWRDVATVLDMKSASAAERRFSKTLDRRKERSQLAQPIKTPPGLAGVTVSAASQETSISTTTIHNRILANLNNPDANWFTRTAAENKKGHVDRITDIEGLRAARRVTPRKAAVE